MKYQIIEDFYGNGWHITTDPEDDAIATVWDKADAERLVNLLNGLYVPGEQIAWVAYTHTGKQHLIWKSEGDEEWLKRHYARWEPLLKPSAISGQSK